MWHRAVMRFIQLQRCQGDMKCQRSLIAQARRSSSYLFHSYLCTR
jgi:hypothetical protein